MSDTAETFDPSPYHRLPNADVPTSIALATQLLTAAPRQGTAEQRGAARKLKTSRQALEEAYRAAAPRLRDGGPAERRQADTRIDRAWAALFRRVEATSMLPPDYPEAATAQKLVEGFFSEGLGFLTLSFEAEWAESKRRIDQIDADAALGKQLDQLAGPLFLAEIRKAHDLYGAALGMSAAREQPAQGPSLDAPLRALRRAIAQYARATVATVDEDDPSTIQAAEQALSPIARLREQLRRGQGAAQSGEPAAPADPGA